MPVPGPGGSVVVGSSIKSEMILNISEAFRLNVAPKLRLAELGIFVVTLKKPAADCRNLPRRIQEAGR